MLDQHWQKVPWQNFLRAYKLSDSSARYWKKKFRLVFSKGINPKTGKRCAMINRKQGRRIIDAITQVHMKGG